jgi:mannose/cellobiose epimerase-like protein (N-acyl-D-glucosamine 2-epimerase family)
MTIAEDDPFRLAGVERWMFDEALPFWASVGQDRAGLGFVERVTLDGRPETLSYKRLRVQARQIYVFCHASLLGWRGPALDAARNGMDFVTRNSWLPEGGWASRLGAGGGIEDPTLALYEQSFMLFALGWYARATGETAPVELAHRTIDAVHERLGLDSLPGFLSGPDSDALEQNPHMHYLEAMLVLHETTREARFLDEARGIVALLEAHLFQRDKKVLPEFFDAGWRALPGGRGRLVEPGHHFEWVWLLAEYRRVTGGDASDIARALFDFAEMFGVDRETGLVYDAVLDDGTPHERDHRSWCQTEALKAHLSMSAHGRTVDETRVAQITGGLLDRYLDTSPRGIWIDHITADLKPKSAHVPATSLYHFFLAFSELKRWTAGLPRRSNR